MRVAWGLVLVLNGDKSVAVLMDEAVPGCSTDRGNHRVKAHALKKENREYLGFYRGALAL